MLSTDAAKPCDTEGVAPALGGAPGDVVEVVFRLAATSNVVAVVVVVEVVKVPKASPNRGCWLLLAATDSPSS